MRIWNIIMSTTRCNSINRLGPFPFSQPIKFHASSQKKWIPIQTLEQLWQQQQQAGTTPRFDKSVSKPSQVYLQILRGLKMNISSSPELKLAFLLKIQQNLSSLSHLKYLVLIVLPINDQFPQLSQLYIKVVRNYLQFNYQNNRQLPTFEEIYIILGNLERLTTSTFTNWDDEHWFVNDYTAQQEVMIMLLEPLLKLYHDHKHQYDEELFMQVVRICSVLNVSQPDLLQLLVCLLHDRSKRFRLADILRLLLYLSQSRFFPSEYFYANQSKWIEVIEQYQNYSAKKSNSTISMLQIMISENPPHCERILWRIICLMESNTLSLDNEQLARQWYAASKAKFTLPKSLSQKMICKISQSVQQMKVGELCLLVRGFARFASKKRISCELSTCKSILEKAMGRLPEGRVLDIKTTAQIILSLE